MAELSGGIEDLMGESRGARNQLATQGGGQQRNATPTEASVAVAMDMTISTHAWLTVHHS